MNGADYFEFSIAHDRKYTLDHLWLQVLDEKNDERSVKIGISEFIRAEYGDIVRVVLTKPEDDSEFQIGNGGDEDENDEEENEEEGRRTMRFRFAGAVLGVSVVSE